MVNNKPNLTEYLEAGLRASSLQGKAIANNIANINTPGYRRHEVDFSDVLKDAINDGKPVDLTRLEDAIYQPKDTPVDGNGNDVTLEAEIGEMIKNSGRYKTYMRMLGTYYRQMERAMRTE